VIVSQVAAACGHARRRDATKILAQQRAGSG
jgi:hypothetical protein